MLYTLASLFRKRRDNWKKGLKMRTEGSEKELYYKYPRTLKEAFQEKDNAVEVFPMRKDWKSQLLFYLIFLSALIGAITYVLY